MAKGCNMLSGGGKLSIIQKECFGKVIDLGSEKLVITCFLYCYGWTGSGTVPRVSTIFYGSNDNRNWIEIGRGYFNWESPNVNGAINTVVNKKFRYIKNIFDTSSSYPSGLSINWASRVANITFKE